MRKPEEEGAGRKSNWRANVEGTARRKSRETMGGGEVSHLAGVRQIFFNCGSFYTPCYRGFACHER